MFSLAVEEKTIDEFLTLIETCQFGDTQILDAAFRDFWCKEIKRAKCEAEERINRINALKLLNSRIDLHRECMNVLEVIDGIIDRRREYYEAIEKKYRYKGRYHYKNKKP